MPDRVLVFGDGWLGNKFARALSGATIRTDITNREAVMRALDDVHPTVVVNAAGKTGRPNIDACEKDPAGTLLVNVAGAIILAEECAAREIFMVHLGSGCIYNDSQPQYTEDDPPNFFGSVYSRSKILAERALKELDVLQLRIRMPFSGDPHPRNLITKLVGYPRVISVPNSMTRIEDLIMAAECLISQRSTGIWNVVNPGAVTHGEILTLYRNLVDPEHRFEIMPLHELATVTKAGRSNCVLSTEKLMRAGVLMPNVDVALIESLTRYKQSL